MEITNETFLINPSTKAVTYHEAEVPPPDQNQVLVYAGIEVTAGMIEEADDYLAAHPGYGEPLRIAWR